MRLEIRKKLGGGTDLRELTMQTRQRNGVNLLGRVAHAVWSSAVERSATVSGEISGKAKIAGHAGGGFHAVVRGQPADDDGRDPTLPEPRFEIGADEGAIHPLGNDRLVPERFRALLVLDAWQSGFER